MLLPLYTASTGLNDIVDHTRVQFNAESGVTDLVECKDIDIDDSGAIFRRQGQSLLKAGEFHSLFCNKGDCFVVEDITDSALLWQVGTDYSLTGVRSGLTKGERLSYWQLGENTYYSSRTFNGLIISGSSYDWPTNEHVGETTVRSFYPAPLGTHIAIHNGRMWIALDNTIWISEPYAYGKFDKSRRYLQFASNVRMIRPVDGGVWVSTDTSTGFIKNTDKIDQMEYDIKSATPAHEYSDCIELVDLSKTVLETKGLSAVWSSDQGLVVGSETGALDVVTKDKLNYPNGSKGVTVADGHNIINSVY